MLPNFNEKAWLYHRGRWSRIKNPLYRKGLPGASTRPRRQTLRQILQGYNLRWWTFGPAFLLPHYTGTLIYTYARKEVGQGPEYLVWIDTTGPSEIFFVQDLLDLLNALNLLIPIVYVDILVDVYKRVADAYLVSQNNNTGYP